MTSKTASASTSATSTPWVHYKRGARVGEWITTSFTSREAAIEFARANVGATVLEITTHSSMPHERITVRADGTIHSERVTSCG